MEHVRACMNIPEAAQEMGISRARMYDVAKTPGFPVISLFNGKRLIIPRESFMRWLTAQAENKAAGTAE